MSDTPTVRTGAEPVTFAEHKHSYRWMMTLITIVAIGLASLGAYDTLVAMPAQERALKAQEAALVAAQDTLKDVVINKALTEAMMDALKSQDKSLATKIDTSLKALGYTKTTGAPATAIPTPGATKP